MSILTKMLITIATVLMVSLPLTSGHGMMWEPTNRGSLWRKGVPGAKALYTDNQQVAGGPGVARANWPAEHKYGICGDPYSASRPRRQETGGEYGKGFIASCYETGAEVTFQIIITAHHKGSFDFGICKLVGDAVEEESCFTPLVQPNGAERWALPNSGPAIYQMTYQLPKNLTCFENDHCIIRWHYLTGNSWSPKQAEEFWSCADVKIAPSTSSCQADLAPRAAPGNWQLPISNRAASTNPWVESPQWHQGDNVGQSLVVDVPTTDSPTVETSAPAGTSQSNTGGATNSQSATGPRPASCGSCNDCQWNHAGASSCYSGWSEIHCVNAGSEYQWCGADVPVAQPLPTEAATSNSGSGNTGSSTQATSSGVTTVTPAGGSSENSDLKPSKCKSCNNCLRSWMNGGRLQTACHAGWRSSQCVGDEYTWCEGEKASASAGEGANQQADADTTPAVTPDPNPIPPQQIPQGSCGCTSGSGCISGSCQACRDTSGSSPVCSDLSAEQCVGDNLSYCGSAVHNSPGVAVQTTSSSPLCKCTSGAGCSSEFQCGNCLLKLGRNRACYAGWNQQQCATGGPMYTWCGGGTPVSAPSQVIPVPTIPPVVDVVQGGSGDSAPTSASASYSGSTYVPIKNIDTYHNGPSSLKKAIVYAGAWTLVDSGRKFFLDQMDSAKMTHILYSFYEPSSTCEAVSSDNWTDTNGRVKLQDGTRIQGVFAAALAWRKKPENAHVKFVLSIGGYNGSGNFAACTTDAKRKKLVDSLLAVVKEYQLDGLDIDWEYPSNTADWNNFRKLLGEVRAGMDGYSPNKHLELSSAIGIGTQHRDAVPNWVCENLDSLNLMYYDVYGIWTGHTEHHAPFDYDPASPVYGKDRLTLVSTIEDLKKNPSCGHGAKLSLGLALYGRSWKVQTGALPNNGKFADSSRTTGVISGDNAATLNGASYGNNILTVGDILTNYLQPNTGFTRYWNKHWQAPYIYNPTTGVWAGYDDEESMMIKVKYAEAQGLGSVFFWQASDDKGAGLIPKVYDYITRDQNA